MNLLRQALLLAAIVSSATRLEAQSQLHGRIVSDSGKPVAGATVTVGGVRYSVKTDSLGQFRLAGTPGSTLELTLRANGFRDQSASVVLTRGRPQLRDFVLLSEAAALPEANPSDKLLRIQVVTEENEPLSYANLQVNGGRIVVANDSGRLAVPIPSGRARLLLRRIGYEPTEAIVESMPDTALRVRMKAVARTLEAQVITVRSPFVRLEMGGFYARMAEVQKGARVGWFVTPEELELRRPKDVTDAVRHFPNIRLSPIDDGHVDYSAGIPMTWSDGMPLARKFRIEDADGCPLTVFLDRQRIQPSVVSLKMVDEEINSIVQPQALAGIEVYPRVSGAPPGYVAVGGTCGVVLLWSK